MMCLSFRPAAGLRGSLFLLLFSALLCPAQVRITEFMAANSGFLLDEDGDSSDWIELFNSGSNTVNLANWCLTDSASNLNKWRFPVTNLPPGQFLVVFASEKNRRVPGRPLHTNFKLDKEGEYLALVEPDGVTVVSEYAPAFPVQMVNVSYGLGMQQSQTLALTTNAVGRMRVPPDGSLGLTWTQPDFDDTGWSRATNGLGYELGTSELPPAAIRILNAGAIGYWRLNDTSGAAANLGTLGYQANGTYGGAPLLGQAGLRPPTYGGYESNNLAVRFGPSTGYVTTGQPLLSGRFAFTLSGWFNAQSLSTSRIGLWGQNDAIEFGFINPTTLSVWTAAGGSLDVSVSIALNTWHHVAAVGDGSTLKIYLDGQLLGTGGGNTLDYGSSDYPFNIGGGGVWDAGGNQFDGLIDEVAVYDRALSADEVLLEFRSAAGGLAGLDYLSYLNPEGWWRLNETSGSIAHNAGSLGSALDFPYVNSPVLGVAGIRPPSQAGFEADNYAVRFNGSNQRVESSTFQPDLSTPVFSVSAWARLTGGSGERVVVSSRDYGTPRGYILAASTSRWRYYVADTNGFRALEGPLLTSNTWVHLVGTFDGATARFYVNGALAASTNLGQFQPNVANKFRIGYGSYTSSAGFFPGEVDEVAFFKRALSGAEVTNLYTCAVTGVASSAATNFYYTPFIRTPVQSALFGINSGLYWRAPFTVLNPADIASLRLRARYDDGFAAYLNGVEVAAANVPPTLAWNSSALSERTSFQAVQWQEFDLTAQRGWLVPGTNWLAVHALNLSPTNSDFLFQCELETGVAGTAFSVPRYFSAPTPGSANGSGAADLGPILSSVASVPALPAQPYTTNAIIVTARVQPAFAPVTSVTLNWRVMFNPLTQTPMLDDGLHGDGAAGDGVYGAVIPAGVAAAGQMIRWFITASDGSDRTSRWPVFNSATDSEEHLGTVVADPSIQSALPVLHTFIQNQSAADTRTGTRGSIFYLGEFYDNVLLSLHGQSSAGWAKKSYNLDFTKEHRFKYQPGKARQKDAKLMSNWGDKSRVHNALTHEFIARAGGVSHWCFQVRVQRNGAFWSIADLMEDADDLWMERVGRDPDGALYKIYDALTGTASAEKKTRLYEDKSDLNALITSLNEAVPLATRTTYAYDNLDLPQITSYFVGLALSSSQDHGHKNYYAYRDSNFTGEWALFPWDTDLTWGRNWLDSAGYFTDTLYVDNVLNFYNPSQQNKTANRLYNLMFAVPDFRGMYLRRLRTIMDTLLQPPGTPATNLIIEARINEMMDLMDPPAVGTSDADLDYAKWGSWGNGYQMRPEAQRIITTHLPGRRLWLNSGSALLNGTPIPPSQPTNATLLIASVDANPVSGNQAEEFVRLTNPTALWLDVSNWKLDGAVRFTFKPGTVVPPYAQLYVSPNQRAFRNRATAPRGGMNLFVTGPYSGQLSAWGETVRLLNPVGWEMASLAYPGDPSDVQRYLRVTEIMYNPSPAPAITNDAQQFEYLELRNISTSVTLNLTGVRFTNGIQFSFTGSAVTSLAPGQHVLLVRNQAAFTARYGAGALIAGEYAGALDNAGETLRLEDAVGEKVLEFAYDNKWYPTTDGLGFSLVIVNELAPWNTWGEKASWRPSSNAEGSPGGADTAPLAQPPVLITEVLTHTDPPQLDAVELHNPTATNVNIGGWFLTDDFFAPRKYRLPNPTLIPPGGFVVFDTDQFGVGDTGFAFSELGEMVFLFSGDAQGNLSGYYHGFDFGEAPNGVSFGRHVDSQGNDHYVLQAFNTLGTNNGPPRVGPVVIAEIMYHPPDLPGGVDDDLNEFIRLVNISATNVPLWCLFTNQAGYGAAARTNTWRLRNAVDFDFPTNQSLAAGGQLLVVGFDPATNAAQLAAFRLTYNLATNLPIYGPWSGKLDNSEDTLELKYPDMPEVTPTNVIIPYVLVDKVTYHDTPPWPMGADGLGLSLQRRALAEFGNDPLNWRAAPPPGTLAADTDADGMADWWEVLNGLVVGINDAALDPDGDGMTNGQEYLARTDPHDSASALRLTATLVGSGLRLSFEAQADLAYTVQYNLNLGSANWQPWQQIPPAAINRIVTLTNTLVSQPRFFRILATQAP